MVICSHVLEHVPDDAAALREIRRILRPGGRALLLVPFALDGKGTDEDLDPRRSGRARPPLRPVGPRAALRPRRLPRGGCGPRASRPRSSTPSRAIPRRRRGSGSTRSSSCRSGPGRPPMPAPDGAGAAAPKSASSSRTRTPGAAGRLPRARWRRSSATASPFEVIVVDNGSAVPPAAACARFPGARLLSEPTPGPGPARSRRRGGGARRDPRLHRRRLPRRPRLDRGDRPRLRRAGGAEIVGGDVRIAPDDPARLTVVEAYESVFGYRHAALHRARPLRRHLQHGGAAGDLRAVGPFAGIGVAEDMDWGRRATRPRLPPPLSCRRCGCAPRRAATSPSSRASGTATSRISTPRTAPAAGWPRLRWLGRAALVAASPLAEAATIARSDRLSRPGDRGRGAARASPGSGSTGRADAAPGARRRPGRASPAAGGEPRRAMFTGSWLPPPAVD